MRLPDHLRTVDIDGTPVLWAWGSLGYRPARKGWHCRHCGGKPDCARGFLLYADGDEVCMKCAKAWAEQNWQPPPAKPAPGQQALALEP